MTITTYPDLTTHLLGEFRNDYSGRGMHGKTCYAWEYDSEKKAVVDMMTALIEADEDVSGDLLKIFKDYAIDSMGLGVVLYFPKYKGNNQRF